MIFVDRNQKRIELTDSEILISRADDKWRRGYSRIIPYSSVQEVVFQKGFLFREGFFSLITISGGITEAQYDKSKNRWSLALEDETTFNFDNKDFFEIDKLIFYINQKISKVTEKSNSLIEFWGMTYNESKTSYTVLLPEGIQYNRNGNVYILPYDEILKIDYVPDHELIIMKKGIDGKFRLKEYKKTRSLSEEDKKYSFEFYQMEKSWEKHFFKALNIIMDNRHLIRYSQRESSKTNDLVLDQINGFDFEKLCAEMLLNNGFKNISVTPKSGDHGVDILAVKDDIKYAFQCKCHSEKVGNASVQEVYAGKTYYNCHVGVVMTNSEFTSGAISLADATGILLWDRSRLKEMLKTNNK